MTKVIMAFEVKIDDDWMNDAVPDGLKDDIDGVGKAIARSMSVAGMADGRDAARFIEHYTEDEWEDWIDDRGYRQRRRSALLAEFQIPDDPRRSDREYDAAVEAGHPTVTGGAA